MADNYLEKRYEEVFGGGASKKIVRHTAPTLNTLLVKNRSIRRWRQNFAATTDQLRTIVGVNANVASAMNRQVLRFRALTAADSPDMVNALRQLLFREEIRPYTATAYIIVYSTIPEERYVDIDLGISLQSMSLKAVELGLNCLIKGNIDKNGLRELFPEPADLEPVAVLCVGKKDESVFLKPVSSSEDLTPYTKDDVHYVPKLTLDDLML